MNRIPFALFDDHSLTVHALKRLLLQISSLKFLFKTTSKNILLESLDSQFPQLLFICYPFALTESEDVIRRVRKKCPLIKIIVLTNVVHSATILKLIDDGANCVVSTDVRFRELEMAVAQTLERDYCYNELFSKSMHSELKKLHILKKNSPEAEELSPDEIDLINELYAEKTHKEIADEKHVLPATIDSYVSRLIHKVGVKNAIGLVKHGLKNKLIINGV